MITQLFKNIRQLIAEKKFEELRQLDIVKPEKFNWAKEVFEGINMQEHPDAKALIWTNGSETQVYTYRKILGQSDQLINFLRKHGMIPGDTIFSQIPLLPENWLCYLVAVKGGFCLVPAATALSIQDIVYRFEKLMPRIVLADITNAEKIEQAEKLIGKNVSLKILAEGERKGWVSMKEIHEESEEAEAAQTKPDDPLFLFFTSGTTDMPKLVTHTHLSYPFGHLTTAAWIGLKPGDIHYNISQPGWAKFAWSCIFAPWNMGATVFAYHFEGRFNPHDHLSLIEKHKITTLCCPPTVLRLFNQEKLTNYRFSLTECVSAGEPLNPQIIDTWLKGTGLTIRDGYGQTESTCMVGNLPGARLKYGSMGKPTFLYDVVIADKAGNILPDLEEGTLAVRIDSAKPNGIFSGYFNNPEKRREVFSNGLYYSGDRAYRDKEGYIWFVGRDDDVIKSSDYRVGPFEVESIMQEHASILESAAVGSPHVIRGLQVKVFAILREGFTPGKALAEELFAYARKNLAAYKMPRIIEFVDELPKTISGKIRRSELRANEAEQKLKGGKNNYEFFYTNKL
jgi:acetyl-CoA synthetase